jgi:hypothetical protein
VVYFNLSHSSYLYFFSHNSIYRRKKVEFFSFAMILELVNPKPDSVFVDLGHGTGILPIYKYSFICFDASFDILKV